MSFSFISRISLYLSFIFIFSCQDTISSLKNNENIDSEDYTFQLETEEFLDFSFFEQFDENVIDNYTYKACLLYTSPSPRDRQKSRMPSSA